MSQLAATDAGFQLRRKPTAASIKLYVMSRSLYPLDSVPTAESHRITIELTEAEKADVQRVADLWNAFDKARGVRRERKWERKSVLEQFARGALAEFWDQIGGRPTTDDMRESAVAAAVAKLEKEFAPKIKR